MRDLPSGVKETSGGKFDPDEGFVYFLAGDPCWDTPVDHILLAVNELKTKKNIDHLDRLCDERKVMLDSGIFNLAMTHARNNGVSHDVALGLAPEEIDGFEDLWEKYGNLVSRFKDRLWGVVELDQGGVTNKPRTRARIEDELGVIPMPVYHPLLDGWDYYDDLAREYDRLCFGNLVKASPPIRLRLTYTAAERSKPYPYLWTHMLGVTPNQNLLAMPYRGSCDSSAWLSAVRWQTAWSGWASLQMVSKYPPTMWSHKGTGIGGEATREKAIAVIGNTAAARERTFRALGEDTHTSWK